MVDFSLIRKCHTIAEKCMSAIDYDNGHVNCYNPEKISEQWKEFIALAAYGFFKDYPINQFTDEDIELICNGDIEEVFDKFGKYKGWEKFDVSLNEYHDPTTTCRVKYPKSMLEERLNYFVHCYNCTGVGCPVCSGMGKLLNRFDEKEYKEFILPEDESKQIWVDVEENN